MNIRTAPAYAMIFPVLPILRSFPRILRRLIDLTVVGLAIASLAAEVQSVQADWPLRQITNSSLQFSPHLNGDILVWEDLGNGSSDILGYDLKTNHEFVVYADSGKDETNPYVFGNTVIWFEHGATMGKGSIMGKNIETGQVFTIASNAEPTYNNSATTIDQTVVVWKRDFGTWASNLPDGKEFLVSVGQWPVSQTIAYPLVLWEDTDFPALYEQDVIVKDLETGLEQRLISPGSSEQNPAAYGKIVVYSTNRNGHPESLSDYEDNWDIYKTDLQTGTTCPLIADPERAEKRPSIWKETVVCESHCLPNNGYSEIWGYNLSTQNTFPIVTPAETNGYLSCRFPCISERGVVFEGTNFRGEVNIYLATPPIDPNEADAGESGDAILNAEPK